MISKTKKTRDPFVRYDVITHAPDGTYTWFCYSAEAAETVAQEMRAEYPTSKIEIVPGETLR